MTRLHRAARIIAPATDAADPASAPRTKRVDYAALLRRRLTPPRPAGAGAQDSDADDYGAAGSDASADDDAPPSPAADPRQRRGLDSLAERIGSVSVPIVDAVYQQQNRFIELTARVAREIAAFCANRAVTQSGNWEVRLPLDPDVLPDTTLYLTLSPLCLQLRFDAQDPSSRQLLLQHSRLLERELTQLLDAWGEPRQLEIAIW
nr:hypothetical protein HUO10_004792 [Paraburkholderia busanensis]